MIGVVVVGDGVVVVGTVLVAVVVDVVSGLCGSW